MHFSRRNFKSINQMVVIHHFNRTFANFDISSSPQQWQLTVLFDTKKPVFFARFIGRTFLQWFNSRSAPAASKLRHKALSCICHSPLVPGLATVVPNGEPLWNSFFSITFSIFFPFFPFFPFFLIYLFLRRKMPKNENRRMEKRVRRTQAERLLATLDRRDQFHGARQGIRHDRRIRDKIGRRTVREPLPTVGVCCCGKTSRVGDPSPSPLPEPRNGHDGIGRQAVDEAMDEANEADLSGHLIATVQYLW